MGQVTPLLNAVLNDDMSILNALLDFGTVIANLGSFNIGPMIS